MKALTTLAAGLLAVAFIGTASAQTPEVIRITGSSAYRGQVHGAIAHLLGATGTGSTVSSALTGGATYGYSGASLSGATYAIFKGTIAGTPVIIKTSWSGSVAGVLTVSRGNLPVTFFQDGVTTSASGSGNIVPNSPAPTDPAIVASEIPDVAMSDTLQSSTPFNHPTLDTQLVEPTSGGSNSAVGVVPFVWVAGTGAPAGLTNITPQLAKALFGNGSASLAQFTGLDADAATLIYAIGRDPDSGTRVTAFAEAGIKGSVSQYQPTIVSNVVTSQAPWPQSTVNGITFTIGNGGYSSGGTLAAAMGATPTALNGGCYVTYLSTGDASTAVTAGAKRIAFNGVTLNTSTFDEIKNGSYTFWSYERMLYRASLATAKKTVAAAIATQIRTTDATLLIGQLKVSRQDDGGTVTHN